MLKYFTALLKLYWSGTLEEFWKVGDSRHQYKLRGRRRDEIFYSSVWSCIVIEIYWSSEKLVIEAEGKLKYFKALLEVTWSGSWRSWKLELQLETLFGDSRHQSRLRGGRKANVVYSSVGGVMKWNVGRSFEKLVIADTNQSWEVEG